MNWRSPYSVYGPNGVMNVDTQPQSYRKVYRQVYGLVIVTAIVTLITKNSSDRDSVMT